jgi:hypothetical protein
MERRQTLRDHRNVAGADLEKAVAAERTAAPALQVLRLLAHDRIEMLIGALKDGSVVLFDW